MNGSTLMTIAAVIYIALPYLSGAPEDIDPGISAILIAAYAVCLSIEKHGRG